jgi:hypothetical protein
MAYDMDEYLNELHAYEIVYTQGDTVNGAVPVGQTCGLIHSILDVDDLISGYTKKAENIMKNLCSKIS